MGMQITPHSCVTCGLLESLLVCVVGGGHACPSSTWHTGGAWETGARLGGGGIFAQVRGTGPALGPKPVVYLRSHQWPALLSGCESGREWPIGIVENSIHGHLPGPRGSPVCRHSLTLGVEGRAGRLMLTSVKWGRWHLPTFLFVIPLRVTGLGTNLGLKPGASDSRTLTADLLLPQQALVTWLAPHLPPLPIWSF